MVPRGGGLKRLLPLGHSKAIEQHIHICGRPNSFITWTGEPIAIVESDAGIGEPRPEAGDLENKQ